MDFSVSTRLRELGIRIALGANRRNVLGIVFSRVVLQVALGAALGLALGFALGTALSVVLPGVESWNTAVSVTVIIILGVTCTAGALLPALNALRADPVEALRAE
jgi:ABC-type antimicrobial peptide transport system permease subunit